MNIAINGIPLLSPLTGIGKYTLEISRGLGDMTEENEFSFYYGYFSRKLREAAPASGLASGVKRIPFLRKAGRRLRGVLCPLTLRKFDLYFEPNFIPLPISARRTVVTVADFSFEENPNWHPRERIDFFRENFWAKIDRADRIIVISDFIKSAALNRGLPEEKLRTIHLGVDHNLFHIRPEEESTLTREKYALPEKFILFVGSVEPRKNLSRLIKAFLSLAPALRKEYKLVLVGFSGWENGEIMELLGRGGEDIRYLGYVSESDLSKIYNLADVFAYPTLYEGFGLPALEAMASGCPVLTSATSSLPEVCGNAAVYVDPLDEESMIAGLEKMLLDENLRSELRSNGLNHSINFSWRKSAERHFEIFQECF